MQIRSKRKFFELWEAGVLGNRTKLFHTLEEALSSGEKQIGFREVGKTGGGAWVLHKQKDSLTRLEFEVVVAVEYSIWVAKGRTFIMDNSVPNDHSVMQGEVIRTYNGLESFLAIGRGLAPMRITMAQGLHKHRGGAETNVILERYMDPSSRDDLRDIMDLYPDAAVEFTCFDVNVGNLPHRNTIFWEIRNY